MSPTMHPAGDMRSRRVAGAIVLSVGLHAATLAHLSPVGMPVPSPRLPPITVDSLLKAISPVPAHPAVPSAAMPAQAARQPSATPPAPTRQIMAVRDEAAPAGGPRIAATAATPEPAAPATAPAAVAPTDQRTAPAAEKPAAATPALDLDALASQYGRQVADLLVSRKRYPRVAQMRGWQGQVEVEARFVPGGRLGQVVVTRSSGHETLDAAAVELLQGAEFPPLPASLAQADFRLRLPIDYRLQN